MDTVLVQINNKKAYRLLQDLEDLKVITVIERNELPKEKLSEKYAGKLPLEIGKELQNYIKKSRDEWDDRLSD